MTLSSKTRNYPKLQGQIPHPPQISSFHIYQTDLPPSITMFCPVMYEEASEHRN